MIPLVGRLQEASEKMRLAADRHRIFGENVSPGDVAEVCQSLALALEAAEACVKVHTMYTKACV